MVAIASQYGCLQKSSAVSHITSGFLHHIIMCPQHITMFLDTASWHLPVCCNRELTGRVLELLVMVYTDDIKGGVTRLIHELNIRVA